MNKPKQQSPVIIRYYGAFYLTHINTQRYESINILRTPQELGQLDLFDGLLNEWSGSCGI